MHLAELPLKQPAKIAAIDWVVLGETATRRLRALGFDAGVIVETLHTAGLIARDPLAVRVGRMTVAIRKAQAEAVMLEPQ